MKRKSVPVLAKKSEKLRVELHLTQKEVADETHVTESACRAYELGDRNPKSEILGRIAKVLDARLEYLGAPTFRNRREFAYGLLENEDLFGYTVCNIDGAAAIATGCGLLLGAFLPNSFTTGKTCERNSTITRSQKMNMRPGSAPEVTVYGSKSTTARARIRRSKLDYTVFSDWRNIGTNGIR